MYNKFVKERIYHLVEENGISERRLSHRLGHSDSYIHQITSYNTPTLPSMESFFEICEYFQITPAEFFAEDSPMNNPLIKKLISLIKDCPPEDIIALINVASRFSGHRG